jgi:hypothetical protein
VIVHDVATLFTTVIHRAVLAVEVGAGFAAMVLCAVPLLLPPAARAITRRVTRPAWARKALGARRYARTRARGPQSRTAPLPHWARTDRHTHDHHDFREAA